MSNKTRYNLWYCVEPQKIKIKSADFFEVETFNSEIFGIYFSYHFGKGTLRNFFLQQPNLPYKVSFDGNEIEFLNTRKLIFREKHLGGKDGLQFVYFGNLNPLEVVLKKAEDFCCQFKWRNVDSAFSLSIPLVSIFSIELTINPIQKYSSKDVNVGALWLSVFCKDTAIWQGKYPLEETLNKNIKTFIVNLRSKITFSLTKFPRNTDITESLIQNMINQCFKDI